VRVADFVLIEVASSRMLRTRDALTPHRLAHRIEGAGAIHTETPPPVLHNRRTLGLREVHQDAPERRADAQAVQLNQRMEAMDTIIVAMSAPRREWGGVGWRQGFCAYCA
jgi:hypothetical protein